MCTKLNKYFAGFQSQQIVTIYVKLKALHQQKCCGKLWKTLECITKREQTAFMPLIQNVWNSLAVFYLYLFLFFYFFLFPSQAKSSKVRALTRKYENTKILQILHIKIASFHPSNPCNNLFVYKIVYEDDGGQHFHNLLPADVKRTLCDL